MWCHFNLTLEINQCQTLWTDLEWRKQIHIVCVWHSKIKQRQKATLDLCSVIDMEKTWSVVVEEDQRRSSTVKFSADRSGFFSATILKVLNERQPLIGGGVVFQTSVHSHLLTKCVRLRWTAQSPLGGALVVLPLVLDLNVTNSPKKVEQVHEDSSIQSKQV